MVDSKAGRSQAAVGDEVAAELLECDQRSRERFGDDRPAFFVTSTGNPVSPGMPGVVFRRVWTRAGLSGHKPANGPGPMISGTRRPSRRTASAWNLRSDGSKPRKARSAAIGFRAFRPGAPGRWVEWMRPERGY